MDVHRCLIVPAELAPQIRAMCEQLAGMPGAGMFVAELSPTGTPPATHFISSGDIDARFATVMDSPAAMQAACASAGIEVTVAACEAILSACSITAAEPADAVAALGLKPVQLVRAI